MEKTVKGMTIKIGGDASELKAELREVRSLAEKASAAISNCASEAERMSRVIDMEAPDEDAVQLSLRRFVVRTAEDEEATPDQLRAMSEVAKLLF